MIIFLESFMKSLSKFGIFIPLTKHCLEAFYSLLYIFPFSGAQVSTIGKA